MKTNIFYPIVGFLVVVCFVMLLNPSIADVVDEFNTTKLDSKLWEMKQVGKSSYTIEKGILTMESPAVESGIILYHPRNIENMDITFEIKIDTSVIAISIPFGSIGKIMEPQVNTEINNHWLAMLLLLPDGTVNIKRDPDNVGKEIAPTVEQKQYEPGWNVFEITFSASEGKVTYFLDGKEIGEVEKNKDAKERYFFISPDIYTSHYTGDAIIDYIKISGPGSAGLSIDPLDKLASTWAKIKR